jgi:hypothetical protein
MKCNIQEEVFAIVNPPGMKVTEINLQIETIEGRLFPDSN